MNGHYSAPTKLRESNVFTCVCLFTKGVGVGISGPMSFAVGVDAYVLGGGYVWGRVLECFLVDFLNAEDICSCICFCKNNYEVHLGKS